jgi:long-subunit fatty acid transport protein
VLCAVTLFGATGVAIAQNNTNSPYSRYGFGDLPDATFGNSKAMGGIAYGLRDGAQINAMNPASYTAIDSLTFIMSAGVTLQNANMSQGGMKQNAKNSSFDYFAAQFRIQSWLAMSIGVLPASYVGYSVSDTQTATNDGTSVVFGRQFSGDGGLHEVYGGLGAKLFKGFSVGFNFGYLWGDVTRSRSLTPAATEASTFLQTSTLTVTDYKLDFGLQYTQKIGKNRELTIGAVYSPKHELSNKYTETLQKYRVSSSQTIIDASTTFNPDATFALPHSFGIGFTYKYDNRLTVGMDYSLQKWSSAQPSINETVEDGQISDNFRDTYMYKDRSKISVGAEYLPNPMGRSFFAHVKYRVGGYYSTPYYTINGKRASREYGVTAGFGLPIPRVRSVLSITGQYARVKGLETNMVNQNIFRLSIGFTFNERWFFKRRVE